MSGIGLLTLSLVLAEPGTVCLDIGCLAAPQVVFFAGFREYSVPKVVLYFWLLESSHLKGAQGPVSVHVVRGRPRRITLLAYHINNAGHMFREWLVTVTHVDAVCS